MTRLLVIALLVASAAPAAAQRRERRRAPAEEVDRFDWRNATGEAASADYRAALKVADREALRVLNIYPCGRGFPPRALEPALRHYRRAIAADPRQAEPHYRAAMLIHCAYLDKTRDWVYSPSERRWAEQVLDHLARFERLAPHDPRLGDTTYLGPFHFERAIVHTKLAATRATVEEQTAQYRLAIADYDHSIRHLREATPALFSSRDIAISVANMAEVCMMAGDLQKALTLYRESLEIDPEYSTAFGLAVALDRDDQGWKARELILKYADPQTLDNYVDRLTGNNPNEPRRIFYVPPGEVHYYMALILDAFGSGGLAIVQYREFLHSGANPQFKQRAKDNISRLRKQPSANTLSPEGKKLAWWRKWLGS